MCCVGVCVRSAGVLRGWVCVCEECGCWCVGVCVESVCGECGCGVSVVWV